MTHVLSAHGLDPLLFGDGRPFGNTPGSLAAKSLPLPLPSTLAGAVRWAVAREAQRHDFDPGYAKQLLQIEIAGPLLTCGGHPWFPVPLDAVAVEVDNKPRLVAAKPTTDSLGCDLPEGVRPCLAPALDGASPSKEQPSGFWSLDDLSKWLVAADAPEGFAPSSRKAIAESRTHVGIRFGASAADEGMLFQTEGACITEVVEKRDEPLDPVAIERREIAFRVRCGSAPPTGVWTLGGERRLAYVHNGPSNAFDPPADLPKALGSSPRLRMVLATPAVFAQGWRPDWVCNAHGLKLVGACVGRHQQVSGWDSLSGSKGPKPVRWTVPAGSVYFFEKQDGSGFDPAASWLAPVSDDEQDRRDGFGLAVWGVW